MGYNSKLGYLIKDDEVKLIKKMVPKIIEGNFYSNDNDGANGYFKLKSFRKYTWTPPTDNPNAFKSKYRYYAEFEFYGSFTMWGTVYHEKSWQYMKAWRRKNVSRSLKHFSSNLLKEAMSILALDIPHWDIEVTKAELKNPK